MPPPSEEIDMARKKYRSMQEELAARKAAREQGTEESRPAFSSNDNSRNGSFRAYKRKEKKPDPLPDPDPDQDIMTYTDEESTGIFSKSGTGFSMTSAFIVIGLVVAMSVIAYSLFVVDEDVTDYEDEMDIISDVAGIETTSTHSDVLKYLDENVDDDWNVDTDELEGWIDTDLEDVVGDRLNIWKTEVYDNYMILRTVYDGKGRSGEFAEKCQDLSEDIETAIDDELEYHVPVVIEARMSPTGYTPGTIDDDANLTFLSVEGDEMFSYSEY